MSLQQCIDPENLLGVVDDLHWLEGPFTKEEIDEIISSHLPCDKSLGPYGLNGDFLKARWTQISNFSMIFGIAFTEHEWFIHHPCAQA